MLGDRPLGPPPPPDATISNSIKKVLILLRFSAVGCSGTLVIIDIVNFIIVVVALGSRRTNNVALPFFLLLDPAIIQQGCTCHECDYQHGSKATDH